MIYFETSAWNRLADRSDRGSIAERIHARSLRVVTGVFAVGELLTTSASERRRLLCETVTSVIRTTDPLLDHPEYLVKWAADAWRRGEKDFLARQSQGAENLSFFLDNPDRFDDDARREIVRWIQEGVHADHQAAFDNLAKIGPRVGPPFRSPEVLVTPAFNELLAEKIPVVAELGLSVDELIQLCDDCDIWRAYRSMAAFIIDAAIARMSETRPNPASGRPQRRPGGPDPRQAVYLGACDTFVLRDGWLAESLTQIAAAAQLQRRIAATEEFFSEMAA